MALTQALSLAQRVNWVIVRRVAVAVYLLVVAIYVWREGIPLDRVGQAVWVLIGLATACIGRPWRTWVKLIVSWTLFEGVLLAYDYSRGAAYHYTGQFIGGYPAEGARNTLGMPLHVTFPIRADEWMFGGTLPTHWVQEHLHPGHTISIIAVIVSLTYLSHFLVTPVLAMVLWFVRRELFITWLVLALAVAVIGLTGYFLFPMSPPWLASRQGYISGPPVLTLTTEGWGKIGLKFAASMIDSGRALANPVAAMPSLHTAYATLVAGFFLFVAKHRWVKIAVLFYPVVMGISLLYGGEHYVIDEIFGVLTSAVIIACWQAIRWRRRYGQWWGKPAEVVDSAAGSAAGSADGSVAGSPDGSVAGSVAGSADDDEDRRDEAVTQPV